MSKLTIDSDRRQHTMDVVINTLFSDVYKKHIDTIHAKFPPGVDLNADDIDKPGNEQAIESIRLMANYYEFLAIAIDNESVDEHILRECMKHVACNFQKKIEPYIEYARVKYGKLDDGKTIYNYYGSMCDRWRTQSKKMPLN